MTSHPRPIILANEGQLRDYLDNMQAIGADPVVSGMGAKCRPFLAQKVSLNGEPLYEVIWENPVATKGDKRNGDPGVCKHCNSVLDRHTTSELNYPVSVFTHDIDALVPEGSQGEPVVEQPPPVDEIEELLAETEHPGKGNDK